MLAILMGLLAAVVLVVAVSARKVAPVRAGFSARAAVEPAYPQAVKSDRLIQTIPIEPPIGSPAPAPKPVVTERIIEAPEPAKPARIEPERDSVCGAKGRTWHTKDNGGRYWRCNR